MLERRQKPVLKILLVDDNEENRFTINAFMRDLSWKVDEVKNGQEALDYLKSCHYDLILMDIQMPLMDGYKCTEAIRALEQTQDLTPTPIIALTAYAHHEVVDKCLQSGFNGHLGKPIGKKALISTIEQYTHEVNEGLIFELNALKEKFLKIRPKELLNLREALEKSDFDTLLMIGHKLIGTAGSLEFDDLCAIARNIEDSATHKDIPRLTVLLDQYELALKRHLF